MKRVLIGLLVLSAVSFAGQNSVNDCNSRTFTNRFGINYGMGGSEKSADKDVLDMDGNNIFNTSMGIDYKLLYNVTDRFRWGLELGYQKIDYTSEFKSYVNDKYKDDLEDSIGTLMLGPTLEYDVYNGDIIEFYLNGTLGFAYNKTEKEYTKNYDHGYSRRCTDTLIQGAYAKIGLGVRLYNRLGFEVGRREEGFLYLDGEEGKNTTLLRGLTYFELNYSF